MTNEKATALHWLVVGYISPAAREWIEEAGGRVLDLSSDPPLIAVALAYNPDGCWVWSHGRQEHRQGVEYWNTGELQESSTGITLQYRNIDEHASTEYASVVDNYLILPDEEFDAAARQVKATSEEGEQDQAQPGIVYPPDDDELGDLDEAPF